MRNSSKFVLMIFTFFSISSFAGTLYSFTDNTLIGFQERGQISGSYMYSARANNQRFDCSFSFKTIGSSKKEKYQIRAWEKNKYFHAKAKGYLYITDDNWRIQINFPSAGCRGVPIQMFLPGDSEINLFTISEKKDALGLYSLSKNSSYYDESKSGFEPRKAKGYYLGKDDLVGVIKKQGDFTYVEQYSWTSRAIQSFGWIKSIDLGDSISK